MTLEGDYEYYRALYEECNGDYELFCSIYYNK